MAPATSFCGAWVSCAGFVRQSDIACRVGGEEFSVLLPEASMQIATQRAEAIRKAVQELKAQYEDHTLSGITISLGSRLFRITARLRSRSCTLRTRLCTTPSTGAATEWSRRERRPPPAACARLSAPCPLRVSRISAIIAAPHACSSARRGGRFCGLTPTCVRAAEHQTTG